LGEGEEQEKKEEKGRKEGRVAYLGIRRLAAAVVIKKTRAMEMIITWGLTNTEARLIYCQFDNSVSSITPESVRNIPSPPDLLLNFVNFVEVITMKILFVD
jgi:hypothetical protein